MSTWFSLMTPRWRSSRRSTLANSAADAGHADHGRPTSTSSGRSFGYTGRHDRDAGRAGRRPRDPAAAARSCSPRDRDDAVDDRQRDARRGAGGPPAGAPRRVRLAHPRGRPRLPARHPDPGRDRDGDDRRDPRRRDVPARRSAPTTTARAWCSTCPATGPAGSARPPAATATPSRPTAPASRPTLRPLPQPRNCRSTSRKTSGCSECTQCPAPLTVTRRLRGNQRSIAAA